MQIFFTVADGGSGRSRDLFVRASPRATVGDVIEAVEGQPAPPGTWSVDGRRLGGDESLVQWIQDGSVLTKGGGFPVASPVDRAPAPVIRLDGAIRIDLRVVGGPCAGQQWTLGPGRYVIGRAPEADITLAADARLSRRHAVLTVMDQQIWVQDLDSVNGLMVRGQMVKESSLGPGEAAQLGESVVAWSLHDGSEHQRSAVVVMNPEGGTTFNRPPRIVDQIEQTRVTFPGEKPERQKAPFSVVALVIPVLMGLGMCLGAKLLGGKHEPFNPVFLLMALASPAMMLGNYLSTNRRGKGTFESKLTAYEEHLAEARSRMAAAVAHETNVLRTSFPDPAELSIVATTPRPTLWQRRPANGDFLSLRLGLTDRPASVVVDGVVPPEDERRCFLEKVPATVDLREVGVLGVAGPRSSCEALTRLLVAQLTVFHAPDDVVVTIFTGSGHERAWSWARWLPHVRPASPDFLTRIGSSDHSLDELAADLAQMVEARLTRREAAATEAMDEASHVVVLDGAYRLGSIPAITRVLRFGPSVGVYAICLDETERLLPEECRAVAQFSPVEPTRLALRASQSAPVADVLGDLVTSEWAERVARAIAPIRLNRRNEAESAIPTSLRLLDLLELDDPDESAIIRRWSELGRTTAALIGATARGPLVLDLSRDGPHGLVAGTTGSGKSELLQTIIASLAVVNRPDAMNFVLVDYKGGSAFKDCAELPHTVGMVTDLDGHLTERALASLGAELRRRERLLQQAGTKDIEDYWRATDGTGATPMSRLVLVIDEFAAMVEELPDFVEGLVDLARRGRSLGINLILATQRPSGVVSPAIKTNTNLRIAMRVTDAADSTDVIDSPLAARIAKAAAGRAYLRVGHEQLTEFQAARVGGRRSVDSVADLEVTPVTWTGLGDPPPAARTTTVTSESTDLSELVAVINRAMAQAGMLVPPSPWLPPLPNQITLAHSANLSPRPSAGTCGQGHEIDSNARFCDVCGEDQSVRPRSAPVDLPKLPSEFGPLTAVFGFEDRPEIQAQQPAGWDIERSGHLLVVGDSGSGRSTFLRTLAGSLADRISAREVHLYGVDCGNGALLPLADLPHCGAVVTRNEVDRVDRLIGRLLAEVTRRQEILSLGGFSTIADQRGMSDAGDRLPFIVVMIDRWEGFVSEFDPVDNGRLVSSFMHLMKEAPGVGIRVVATGDRTALSARFSALVETTIVLRMNDRGNYSMAGLNPRKMPDELRPGQAFRSGSGAEIQIALLDPDPAGPAQTAAFRAVAANAAGRDQWLDRHQLPLPIGVLPQRTFLGGALASLDPHQTYAHGGPLLLGGVGGDHVEPQWVNLAEMGPAFMVGGPPRSGRSTALVVMTRSLLAQGRRVLIVLGRPSPLSTLAGHDGVVDVAEGRTLARDTLEELLGDGSVTDVVIDDAELLVDSAIGDPLANFLKSARDHGRTMVVGGTTQDLANGFRGFPAEARKSKSGLVLCPGAPGDGELVGTRLPRTAVFPGPPGRGVLSTRDGMVLVQVPLDDQELQS